jgi:hypothetical protein
MSSTPRLSVRITLLFASLVFALLVAEIGLRVLGISYPRWLLIDDRLGSVHRPGVVFRQKDEGNAIIRINKAGYRDVERTIAKPAGTVRLAVLGDSYVEAGQVDQEEMITRVMERALNGCHAFGERPVEVLNFGMTGYGTAQELLLLQDKVWAFEPDIVVLAFLTGNDLRNNSARLQRDPVRPYFIYRDSVLVFDDSFRPKYSTLGSLKRKAGQTLLDLSRVAQVVYRAQGQAQKRRAALRKDETRVALEQGLDDLIYVPPQDSAWDEAWKITEELLRRVRDEAAAHGAKLLVVTLSNAVQVDPDPARRAEAAGRLGATDLFYPDDRLAAAGARDGYPVLVLARPLQAIAERKQLTLHGFPGQNLGTGHWNADGHRLGGQIVADEVARRFGAGPCGSLEP